MGGGAWLKLKRIRSPPQRGLWAKTLHDVHGRHVLFFEEKKEGEREEKEEERERNRERGKNKKGLLDENVQR